MKEFSIFLFSLPRILKFRWDSRALQLGISVLETIVFLMLLITDGFKIT